MEQKQHRKAVFSVPSVTDIKEASKIRAESEPSIFQAKRSAELGGSSRDADKQTTGSRDTAGPSHPSLVSSVGEASSSRSHQEATTQPKSYHPHAIIVNRLQRNNAIMKHIRNVPWEIGDIVPDFELGKTSCALYLSVRYHALYPDYIHDRLRELGKLYLLRVLLVHVDTSENQKALKELAKIALLADLTLMLAWSYEEAARYLETYKAYENKPPDMLKERTDSDFSSRVIESLTTVKKISKTDAGTLINSFKTMDKLIRSSKEELTLCPGLGPQKAQRLHSLFHEPFLREKPAIAKD